MTAPHLTPEEPSGLDDLLTPEYVAKRYGRNRQWVLRRCHSGAFPHIKIGNTILFSKDHVRQIDEKHTVAPAEKPANPYGRKTRRTS